MTTDFYIYTLNEQGASRRLVSPLDETFATQHGLVKEAIAGEFTGEGTDPASFTANPSFVQFLQWAVAKHVLTAPGFIAQAETQQNGPVFILDQRARLQGGEPQEEDVLGAVELTDGKATGFRGSPVYKTLNEHGFLKIDPYVYEKYLEELREHALGNPANAAANA